MSLVRFTPLLLLALPAAASAQSMNAEAFHHKAVALQKKGPMAIFSRADINALKTEAERAAARVRETRKATLAAGGKARYCPPLQKTSMNSGEFMQRLGAIPAAERARIDMTEATTRILARKFPCPA